MSFLSAVRVALTALLVNKGRSALTSLGIVIGISAVIAMVSAGSGAWDLLDNRLDSVGKNLILIRGGARGSAGVSADFVPLTADDAEAIRKKVGPLLLERRVAESQATKRSCTSRFAKHTTSFVGSVPDVKEIRNWQVKTGRFITDDDVKKLAQICVIGETV